jgi:hypothetical protein
MTGVQAPNAKTGRRLRPPSLAGLIGWLLALVGLVVGSRPLADNSLFTHIATGRLILEHGIPGEDPYSFTAGGEPWVVQSWLVSALYGAVERLGGLAAVRLLAGLLVATLVALAWHLSAGARTLLVRAALLLLVIGAGAPFWAPRPLLFGLVLLALVLAVLVDERDPRLLVPIMWVWVNAHGSFPLGGAAVGALCLGRYLDDRAAARAHRAGGAGRDRAGGGDGDPGDDGRSVDARAVWRPFLWVVVGTLAGAIGPLGPRLLIFPIQLLGRMEVLSRVVEWHSPTFDQIFARAFLAQVVVAVLVLVRRPSYRAAVPLVVFTSLALIGQRSIPHASLVMLPGMAAGLAGLGRIDGRERRPAFAVVGVAGTALAVLFAGQALRSPSVQLAGYPVDGLAWLDGQGVIGVDGRVVTTDVTGNLIELWRGTDARVFLDDRYDMYPLPVTRDYLALNDGTARWDQVLADHDVDWVMWPRSSPLTGLLASSPHWRLRFQDAAVVVACHRGGSLPDGREC